MRFPAAVGRDPAIDAWFESRAGELGSTARPWYEEALAEPIQAAYSQVKSEARSAR